jgi:mono/diheme cytochrome c family protein
MKMKTTLKMILAIAALAFVANTAVASDMPDAAKLFKKKCQMCHHMTKTKMAPAVKAMNSDPEALRSVILGEKPGMMKSQRFSTKLTAEQIESLVVYILAQKD